MLRETAAQDRSPADARSDAPLAVDERCENGVDDNGNGLVDCEDPACATHECVDLPPAGTLGFLRASKGPFPATSPAPACGAGTAERWFVDPGAEVCAPCACAAAAGSACSAPSIKLWDQSGCNAGNSYDKTLLLAKAGCTAGLPTLLSAAVTAPTSPQVTCQPGGGGVVPAFAATVDTCAEPAFGKGCAPGKGCVPRATTPFLYGPCYRSAGTTCPAGLNKLTGYKDYVDTRTCTPCACSLSKLPCVGGSYRFFGCASCSPTCQKVDLAYNLPTLCLELAPFAGSYSVSYTPPQLAPSACGVSGGQAGGSLSLAAPGLLCCAGTK